MNMELKTKIGLLALLLSLLAFSLISNGNITAGATQRTENISILSNRTLENFSEINITYINGSQIDNESIIINSAPVFNISLNIYVDKKLSNSTIILFFLFIFAITREVVRTWK